jgi:DNA sulfur modification protein DndE
MLNIPTQSVRISARSKDMLQRIKNRTRIPNWNIICRWALASSLSNPTQPPAWVAGEESNIEMDWKTFAGEQSAILAGLVRLRALKEGVDTSNQAEVLAHFRAHLERGIASISNAKKVSDLLLIEPA